MTEFGAQPLSPLPKPIILNVPYRPDKTLALAILNQSCMEVMPIADRTRCVQVSLTFLHPDPNGMPGADELPTLERSGVAMFKILEELSAAFVIRNTADAVRTTIFYIPPNAPWKESLQKHLKSFSAYRLQIKSFLDPEWKACRIFLPLVELWRQIALGKALMKHLESEGDDLKTPRVIDHSAAFTDSKGRDAFIKWATENGFTIRKSANLPDAPAPDLILGFERLGIYDSTFLYHLQYHVLVTLARTGGRYLGSGSLVVSKK